MVLCTYFAAREWGCSLLYLFVFVWCWASGGVLAFYFIFSDCLRSSVEFKCGKIWFMYEAFIWCGLMFSWKKHLVFTVLLGREREERSNPKRGRKLTFELDFTNVCWRKNTSAFTLQFYFKVMFGFRRSVELPGQSRRVWYCFILVFCSIKQGKCTRETSAIWVPLMRSGFNSRQVIHDLVTLPYIFPTF